MYKQIPIYAYSGLVKTEIIGHQIDTIERLSDNAFIPFDPANTDYQQFKKDVLEGAELQDADGNVMTQEEATAFVESLE